MEKSATLLIEIPVGSEAIVSEISYGRKAALKLQQLGIRSGCNLRLIRRAPLNGPCLVEVCGREIALGYGLCQKIYVDVKA